MYLCLCAVINCSVYSQLYSNLNICVRLDSQVELPTDLYSNYHLGDIPNMIKEDCSSVIRFDISCGLYFRFFDVFRALKMFDVLSCGSHVVSAVGCNIIFRVVKKAPYVVDCFRYLCLCSSGGTEDGTPPNLKCK